MRKMILISLILTGCSLVKKSPVDPNPIPTGLVGLQSKQVLILTRLAAMQHKPHGWPAMDCDGFIWTSKAVIGGLSGVDMAAAEYPDEPGRFGRRPPTDHRCFEDGVDYGSKSTWSADMLKAGLLPWAWKTKALGPLQRHAAYAEANRWHVGDAVPDAIDRVIYRPNQYGLLYQTIFKLGGDDSDFRLWPDIYPAGLDDYKAHLAAVSIWLRGDMDGSILPAMYERIAEYAALEKQCPFYSYLYARYHTGDFQPVVDLLNADDMTGCSYVRCGDDSRPCQYAEWLFVAALVMEVFP